MLLPVEIAAGTVLGAGPAAALPAATATPSEALEASLLPALARAPCLVSFSGGRDSSTVLALATRAARRSGLPDPVPATIRVPTAPLSHEASWQELVVGHLRLGDWHRLEFADELDLVGPVARGVLDRHGLLWPFNAHFHVPLLEAARGGALLTGIGGDELFQGVTRPRTLTVLTARTRPRRSDVRSIALDLAPLAVRRAWLERSEPALPWLTTAGRAAVRAATAEQAAAEPLRLRHRLRHLHSLRYLGVGVGALALLAAENDCDIRHPLLEPPVWSAVADSAPRHGYGSRSQALEELFAGLLPTALAARPDKACFDEVFMGSHAQGFARRWEGAGVPEQLVDCEALRRHWLGAAPSAQSFTLLQAAWLASRQERVE